MQPEVDWPVVARHEDVRYIFWKDSFNSAVDAARSFVKHLGGSAHVAGDMVVVRYYRNTGHREVRMKVLTVHVPDLPVFHNDRGYHVPSAS
jgi:hypothetical protein